MQPEPALPLRLPSDPLPLLARDGLPPSVHLFEPEQVLALNAALVTGRPLLVRGEPGVGKSQLARAAAELLGRAYVHQAVDSRTDTRDLLYTFDDLARLAAAQLAAVTGSAEGLAPGLFLRPGALWWALCPTGARTQARAAGGPADGVAVSPHPDDPELTRGAVVLVDEIDKADPAVPNGLLDALGHGGFNPRGGERVARLEGGPQPLVLITTNDQRELSDAFLRRCLVLHLNVGEDVVAWLVKRGRVHHPQLAARVLEEAAQAVAGERARTPAGRCAPGLGEYLDLVAAVVGLAPTTRRRVALLKDLAGFVLDKRARARR